jgi:hypothetical protein
MHRREVDDRLEVRMQLPGTRQTWFSHVLTTHELRMGGMDAVRYWMQRLEHDLRQRERIEQLEREDARTEHERTTDAVRARRSQHRQGQAFDLTATEVRRREQLFRQQPGGLFFEEAGMVPPRAWFRTELRPPTREELEQERAVRALHEHQRHEAEAKARALFARVAGEEATLRLERGGAVPLLGSVGGRYELIKRASYCVRRPKDGAELCAVVPGVPLWDHLLGIKLVVETDEPRFLRTANVSGTAGGFRDYAMHLQREMDRRLREDMEQQMRRVRVTVDQGRVRIGPDPRVAPPPAATPEEHYRRLLEGDWLA